MPRIQPIPSDAPPPRADVVVVGGGIVGASAALFLARKGIATVLCEKGEIGAEQSSRNWGWCRKMGRDPREIPLAIEALRLWGEMNAMTGADTGFRRHGIMYLCEDQKELASNEAWLEHARPYQLDTRILSGAEAAKLLPRCAKSWAGALYTASDGYAEPELAAPAIAAAARGHGAAVLTNCAVRGIETQGGRVAAAVTEKGRIACSSLVLAGGAWSSLFCGNLGIRLPQLSVLASVSRTAAVTGGPEVAACGGGFAFRKRLDGGYTIAQLNGNISELVPDSFRFLRDFLPVAWMRRQEIRHRIGRRTLQAWRMPRRWALDKPSPFESARVLDPLPVQAVTERGRARFNAAFPEFAEAPVAERWGGMIDVTPDIVPVISQVDTLPGFFIATGFSGHGFGIGPGAGRLVADLVSGGTPVVDPAPFRLSRFTDGSRPRPYRITV